MEKKKIALIGVGILVLGALAYRAYSSAPELATVSTNPASPDFTGNIPGFTGQGFKSDINVTVNPSILSQLDSKYMPLFGFVGMTTTGSLPTSISSTTTISVIQPPPAQITLQAMARPSTGGSTMNGQPARAGGSGYVF